MGRVVNTQGEFVANDPRYRSVSNKVRAKVLLPLTRISTTRTPSFAKPMIPEITPINSLTF